MYGIIPYILIQYKYGIARKDSRATIGPLANAIHIALRLNTDRGPLFDALPRKKTET